MNDSVEIKKALRATYLSVRRELEPSSVDHWSKSIQARVRTLSIVRDTNTLLCYVASMDNEVETRHLIEWAWAEGKTVLVPIVKGSGLMVWSRVTCWEHLSRTRWGILEPAPDRQAITTPPADAPVIVPGLAFSHAGIRLGYGGGYFDRFLAKHKAVSIGLTFDCLLLESLPCLPHDVPIDVVVTESDTWFCSYHGGV